ncbi:MAG: hypothetical protein ABSA39_12385 [Edaphobacter sp.]
MSSSTQNTNEISCLDDCPELARRSAWQQQVVRYYKLIALAPFAICLFIVLRVFPDSTNRFWIWSVGFTLVWAIAIAGYSFYLLFYGVNCPQCGSGFGVRDQCRSCGLPRHQQSGSTFKEIRLFDEE